MKLKVGDKIREYDGIIAIVYKVTKIDGQKAIAETQFEGKTYTQAYKTKQDDPENIQPWASVIKDSTSRKLVWSAKR